MALVLSSYLAKRELDASELASLVYHDIFDYPLTEGELVKWRGGRKLTISSAPSVGFLNGYYFLAGKEGSVYKRLLKERISRQKLEIARKAGKILTFIPSIKMVAISGALAMRSADEASDIDLLIITKRELLWTSRLKTLLLLKLVRFPVRRFGERDPKNKLCLNMWLDEDALLWPKKDRNAYTAHEIAQTLPLINREKTYEKFIAVNDWIKEFWPNATGVEAERRKKKPKEKIGLSAKLLEKIAFSIQYLYMKRKITKEVIRRNKALFHPKSWSETIMARL